MREVWKPYPEFPNICEVSNLARVRVWVWYRKRLSVPRIVNSWRRGGKNGGYLKVEFRPSKGRIVRRYLHEMVLSSFHGPRPAGMNGLHRNGDESDCRPSNLYWGTQKSNVEDARRHGTMALGDRLPQTKLSKEEVRDIKRRLVAGESVCSIARTVSVTQPTISGIKSGRIWSHVEE